MEWDKEFKEEFDSRPGQCGNDMAYAYYVSFVFLSFLDFYFLDIVKKLVLLMFKDLFKTFELSPCQGAAISA